MTTIQVQHSTESVTFHLPKILKLAHSPIELMFSTMRVALRFLDAYPNVGLPESFLGLSYHKYQGVCRQDNYELGSHDLGHPVNSEDMDVIRIQTGSNIK